MYLAHTQRDQKGLLRMTSDTDWPSQELEKTTEITHKIVDLRFPICQVYLFFRFGGLMNCFFLLSVPYSVFECVFFHIHSSGWTDPKNSGVKLSLPTTETTWLFVLVSTCFQVRPFGLFATRSLGLPGNAHSGFLFFSSRMIPRERERGGLV